MKARSHADAPQTRSGWLEAPPGRLLLVCAVIVAAVMAVIDLTLLEVKYEIFRGGFLQARQIAGTPQVSAFIALLFAGHIAFFALLAGLWLAVSSRLRLHPYVKAYHFVIAFGGAVAALIAIRYQLLSYFGDFFTFTVMKNLGGGDVTDAILYGLQEGAIVAIPIIACTVLYALGHVWLVRRYDFRKAAALPPGHKSPILSAVALSLVAAISLSALILVANQWPAARYHLKKVVSYELPRTTLDFVTDLDRDGVGFFAWEPDMAPLDPLRFPGALDIPGDGIDQDGLEGDFHYSPSGPRSATFPAKKRHLILVVIESARADVLHASMLGQPATPFLQEMASTGGFAEQYFSHTGFTTSSIKAIFSGSLTGQSPFGGSLFALLKSQGYQVVVASGQNESFGGMATALGMEAHATAYFDATRAPEERVFPSKAPGSLTLSNRRVLKAFLDAVEPLDWRVPVFAYVNFQSPHFPYYHDGMRIHVDGLQPLKRSEVSPALKERLRLTYLNAMADADASVRELVNHLKSRVDLGDAVIVVSGDHGESLFDDGTLGHGTQLNDTQLKTLLVASEPFPWLKGALGQTELVANLLAAIGAEVSADAPAEPGDGDQRTKEIFQIIGTLSSPVLLGYVDGAGERLTFNYESREVWASRLQEWLPLKALERHPAERNRFRRLILEWERLRWEDHLSNQPSTPPQASVTLKAPLPDDMRSEAHRSKAR